MAQYPTLKNPPIAFAVIQIRFNSSVKTFSDSVTVDFSKEISAQYPKSTKKNERTINVQDANSAKEKVTIGNTKVLEQQFESLDKTKLLTVSNSVFNLTITKNYTGWDVMIEEFKLLWNKFTSSSKLEINSITGISCRFINRFHLNDFENPSEYFNSSIYAEQNVVLGQVMNFRMNYRTILPDDDIQINVIQGTDDILDKKVNYLFDIDVIQEGQLNRNNIWDKFFNLRGIKNHVFFTNLKQPILEKIS